MLDKKIDLIYTVFYLDYILEKNCLIKLKKWNIWSSWCYAVYLKKAEKFNNGGSLVFIKL